MAIFRYYASAPRHDQNVKTIRDFHVQVLGVLCSLIVYQFIAFTLPEFLTLIRILLLRAPSQSQKHQTVDNFYVSGGRPAPAPDDAHPEHPATAFMSPSRRPKRGPSRGRPSSRTPSVCSNDSNYGSLSSPFHQAAQLITPYSPYPYYYAMAAAAAPAPPSYMRSPNIRSKQHRSAQAARRQNKLMTASNESAKSQQIYSTFKPTAETTAGSADGSCP